MHHNMLICYAETWFITICNLGIDVSGYVARCLENFLCDQAFWLDPLLLSDVEICVTVDEEHLATLYLGLLLQEGKRPINSAQLYCIVSFTFLQEIKGFISKPTNINIIMIQNNLLRHNNCSRFSGREAIFFCPVGSHNMLLYCAQMWTSIALLCLLKSFWQHFLCIWSIWCHAQSNFQFINRIRKTQTVVPGLPLNRLSVKSVYIYSIILVT